MPSLETQLDLLKSKYSRQLTRDEALDLALQAAQLHMEFLRLAKDKSERAQLKDKCNELLDDAHRIKMSDNWELSIYAKGGGDSDAETGKVATSATSRSALEEPVAEQTLRFLDHEESALATSRSLDIILPTRGKVIPMPSKPIANSSMSIQAPIFGHSLSRAEEILLLRGSRLNGIIFPPWKSAPSEDEFHNLEDGVLYFDSSEYRLSDHQKRLLDDWKRPEAALPPPAWRRAPSEEFTKGPTMQTENISDFVQDAATDCSVVASLAAATARAERGHTRILPSILFPYDVKNAMPLISPNGKYIFRLNFNGCLRKVVIDDRLPVSKTQRVLHLVDRNNPSLLWPALLEKAYLKVRGGYDFPGSNSGTDLWILSGWIPEQIILQHDESDPNALWPRMFRAFGFGDVIITMGTGKMTPKAEGESGLAGEHDYAILDLRENDGQRMLLVKNPWLNATTWKDLRLHPNNDDAAEINPEVLSKSKNTDFRAMLSPGTFWMEFGDVMQHFESIYLNWNPSLFTYRQDIHFQWDLEAGRSAVGSFVKNPQQVLVTGQGGIVWLLLSKHFADEPPEEVSNYQGFISLYAFHADGHRVHLSKGAVKQGLYVDSPQTLLRLKAQPEMSYTIVAAEEHLPSRTHVFTLSAFARSPIILEPARSRYEFISQQDASWTKSSAGGNAQSETYSQNPQFSLQLLDDSPVCLFLETLSPHVSVHLKLLHGQGQRVYSVTSRDVIADSGDYRRGCAQATIEHLKTGTYTIICSTFEAGQSAHFTLQAETSAAHVLRSVARDGAGLIRSRLADASFRAGARILAAPLIPHRLTRLSYVAKYAPPRTTALQASGSLHSPTRLTIEIGRGPDRHILNSSGNGSFTESSREIRTPEMNINPEMTSREDMWLVLERLSGFEGLNELEQRLTIDMFSDTDQAVEIGVWREFDR